MRGMRRIYYVRAVLVCQVLNTRWCSKCRLNEVALAHRGASTLVASHWISSPHLDTASRLKHFVVTILPACICIHREVLCGSAGKFRRELVSRWLATADGEPSKRLRWGWSEEENRHSGVMTTDDLAGTHPTVPTSRLHVSYM
jgi:hypothetical protein